MFRRVVTMLPRIILLLVTLLGSRTHSNKETAPLWANAFSALPRATRPTRIHESSIYRSVGTDQPRITTGFSSSLNTWRTPFGSEKKVPTIGTDGLYHITTEEEYRSLMEENPDKLIVLKIFSPWCKSCKALAPKFQALAKRLGTGDAKIPIIWISLAHSKENNPLVRSELGVNAVPFVLLYAGDGVLVDSFRCGPSKVATVLRPKLANLIANHVDISTGTLKNSAGTTAAAKQISLSQPSVNGWLKQSSPASGPLKMFAFLYQLVRSKWQRFMELHNLEGRHQDP